MPTFIAFWNCTIAAHWNATTFANRRASMAAAVAAAAIEKATGAGHGHPWIFLAPEYAMGSLDLGAAKPAEHVTKSEERDLTRQLSALTTANAQLLLAPGTIPVKEGNFLYQTARNTCIAFYAGRRVWGFSKARGIGEISNHEALHRVLRFEPGIGYGQATVAGTTYGAEICADATGAGTLPNQVQNHIIFGQGVGAGVIANKATELQIVADSLGNAGVFDYRGHLGGQAIAAYNSAVVLGVAISYYLA